jgi:hypothetical protein
VPSVIRKALRLLVAAASTLGALLIVVGGNTPAAAATCSSTGAVAVYTTSCEGMVRTSFTLSVGSNCDQGSYYGWDGPNTNLGNFSGKGPQTVVSVPSGAVPGQHTITAYCQIYDPATGRTNTTTGDLPYTVDAPTISLSPSSGPVGSSFKILNQGWPTSCQTVSYTFDSTPLTTISTPADGTGPMVNVPAGATVAAHSVQGSCSVPGYGTISAGSRFTVVQKPVQSSASVTSPANSLPSTTTPAASTSPVSSTPASSTPASSTPASSTPVPTTTAHHTKAAPSPSASTSTFEPPPTLTLSSPDVPPGGGVTASGGGCRAKAPVHLSIEGAPVADTVADETGAFKAPLHTGSLRVGRHDVQAECGVLLVAPLDVVLVSQVSRASSTLAIIVFVLLVGLFIYRRRLLPPAPGRLAAPPSEPEELS